MHTIAVLSMTLALKCLHIFQEVNVLKNFLLIKNYFWKELNVYFSDEQTEFNWDMTELPVFFPKHVAEN